MSDKLREAAQAALDAMSVVRVFVTTEEKIKHPEGTDWYDNIRINLDDSIVNDIKEMNALEDALAEPTVKNSLTVAELHPFEDASVISALSWAATLIEQEYPVGHNGADSWLMNYSDKHGEHIRRSDHREWEKVHGRWKPKAAPPRREWVGLTGDEIEDLNKDQTLWEIIRSAEEILKDKNT